MAEPKTRRTRPTWAQVLEENEWFDGEPEITESAKRAWKAGRYDR